MAGTVSQLSLSFLLRDICIVPALKQTQQLFRDKFTAWMYEKGEGGTGKTSR